MNENDEYKWEGRVGRETLFAGVAGLPCSRTAHNAITTPECTHAEESRAQWAPPPPASCLDNEWRRRSDSPGMDQGGTFLEPWIIWKFVSSLSVSGADCRLAILETYSEIYLSGRMRTVLLKWQYEPWNMVLFLPQPCHHSSLVPLSTKTLI